MTWARWLVLLGLTSLLVGGWLLLPLGATAWDYRPVRGRVVAVIGMPVSANEQRVTLHYLYPVSAAGQRQAQAFGQTLVDERWQPVPELRVPNDVVTWWERQLPGRAVTVYRPVNPAAGEAFIISPTARWSWLQPDHGVPLCGCGVIALLLAYLLRTRTRRTRVLE